MTEPVPMTVEEHSPTLPSPYTKSNQETCDEGIVDVSNKSLREWFLQRLQREKITWDFGKKVILH